MRESIHISKLEEKFIIESNQLWIYSSRVLEWINSKSLTIPSKLIHVYFLKNNFSKAGSLKLPFLVELIQNYWKNPRGILNRFMNWFALILKLNCL